MRHSSEAWVLPVDKPAGITSYDVVDLAKKRLLAGRVGHTGTLDPFATGLLLLCFGRATKIAGLLVGLEKEYEAVVRLGTRTDSDDLTGKVIEEQNADGVSRDDVLTVLKKFTGNIEQVPPTISALKHKGERHYALARKGIEAERKPRDIFVKKLELVSFEPPDLAINVVCSRGTYVRAIARDIGDALGTGAHLHSLRRTRMGGFRIEDAVKTSEIVPGILETGGSRRYTMNEALSFLDCLSIGSESAKRFLHGVPPAREDIIRQPVEWLGVKRVLGEDGELLGIADAEAEGRLKLVRILGSAGGRG